MHGSPSIRPANRRRLAAIPPDGGSWFDMLGRPDEDELLTPSMKHRAATGGLGSHPDVYGRLSWDQPAATIKRECGHIGNGRYAHPEQDRLCTLREMALLQGFPGDYAFVAASLTNRYRHVGDAVPPLVAYQLAALVDWILGADRPAPADMVLPGCSLTPEDIIETESRRSTSASRATCARSASATPVSSARSARCSTPAACASASTAAC